MAQIISTEDLGKNWLKYRGYNAMLDDIPLLELDRLRGNMESEGLDGRGEQAYKLICLYLDQPIIQAELEKELEDDIPF